jgi:hypothetical protein
MNLLLCRSELFSYTSCVSYAVTFSLISLDRVALKSRVVDSTRTQCNNKSCAQLSVTTHSHKSHENCLLVVTPNVTPMFAGLSCSATPPVSATRSRPASSAWTVWHSRAALWTAHTQIRSSHQILHSFDRTHALSQKVLAGCWLLHPCLQV